MNFIAQSRRLPRSFAVLPLLLALLVMPAHAQTPRDAISPVEDFSRQVENLKKTFTDLGAKIEQSARSIDGLSDVDKARKEIELLRALVGNLLGAVSDNGAVSEIGAKALSHARDKVKALESETRFSREEQQYLLGQWRRLMEETERASDELGGVRREFAQLLRVLQTREDFIDELMQIRRASEAITVIRQLSKEIRDASDSLKQLIGAIRPPGA
jgi:DNA repair exonuclease SbcCD ATPase subunit